MGFAGLKAQFVGYDNASLAMQDLINGNLNYVIVMPHRQLPSPPPSTMWHNQVK